MKYKKKPYLRGIHEFGAVAYIKDLKVGKLDACAQLGHFVGYYSKSKGYQIYWPTKRSISVEWNVVFNDANINVDMTTIIPGELSEGEKEKIIQIPENNSECNISKNQPEINSKASADPEVQNLVPFPSMSEIPDRIPSDPIEVAPNDELQLGRGHQVQKKPQGAYSRMRNALPPLQVNAV
jgi:hypothetical protein